MFILSIILPAASFPIARAAPWHIVYARQSNGGPDNNNNNNNNNNAGLSSSVWIPVVFIGGLFLLGAVWVLQKRMSGGSTDSSENEVSDSTTTGQTRELTATDLAGGTRPTNARRQRRPRRTPSQVSTRSLPVYMKEPGDNEVVIYRGLEDMDEEPEGEPQNVRNSTATATDIALDTGRTERDSHDDTRALLPLHTESPELMRHSIRMSQSSYDHQGSDDSHARLIDVQRGEAPAYETIDLNSPVDPTSPHNPQGSLSTGVSGFFSRFMPQRGNNGLINEPMTLPPLSESQNSTTPPSHSRPPSVLSGMSGVASADSHDSPRRSHVGRTHRNNGSSRGSVFTLFTGGLSRNNDGGPLNSPSMISLDSISPPLTHTATRTEFTYPRTGPTSEQVKFLASKETFGRFGVPYGPDAIAFASSSKVNLPPDFDSVHQPSFSDLPPDPDSGSGSSLRRSTSARTGADGNPDLGAPPSPEPMEPPPDLASLPDHPSLPGQNSNPNLGVDAIPSPSRNPLLKQKSTPAIGMGQPSLKSTLQSRSMGNLQKDGGVNGNLALRSTSGTGSYLTVESFKTAHDGGDGPPVPQITVQLPSNNPSLANLAGESGSEAEEFFDGEEGPDGNGGEGRGGENVSPRGKKRGNGEAEAHSNRAETDKALATTDLEAIKIQHLTKSTAGMSRVTAIEA